MKVFCNINDFDLNQTLYLIGDGKMEELGPVPTGALAQVMVAACVQYSVDTIQLSGTRQYLEGLVQKIQTTPSYSEYNIKIEVI